MDMKKHIDPRVLRSFYSGCLTGDEARACYNDLNVGSRGSRRYQYDLRNAYGYFYEEANRAWIAFDNRAASYEVRMFATETEAEQFLIDYDELFAA